MLKTLGGKLVNNIGLKLLAFFLATVLWMVVVNTEDPTVRKSMTVSVFMKNQEYITDMGKYMDVLNDSNTVTFYYTTKRSVWEGISGTDFSATADMEKIEAKASGGYRVPVTVSAMRNANQITIETKQLYLDVDLEDLGKQQFQIKPNTLGTVAEGCALGVVEIVNANVVQVSGPASVVNSIDNVIATVNVEGMSTDITDNVVPFFYDADGELIDTTKLEMSVETVRISAQILNTKEVPLKLSTKGVPETGYQLVDVFCDPVMVQVKGVPAVLNMVDEIKIPAEVLDLTGARETIEKEIDISSYLDMGVSLVSSADAKVNITAEIEPIETREYKIPVNNITAIGLQSGYQLSHAERYVIVNITAGRTAHNSLNVSDIKGTIDVDGLKAGEHVINIKFELDHSVYKMTAAFAEIEIKATGSSGGTDSGNTGGNSGGTTGNTQEEGSEELKPEDSTQAGADSTENASENSTENAGVGESNTGTTESAGNRSD